MIARNNGWGASLLIITLMAGLNTPVYAQTESPDFGDDASEWANDGECDDPRFSGEGMAQELEDADILKDATDCKTLFDAGKIALAGEGDVPALSTTPAGSEENADGDIDFGDDSSEWALDGECDDPRFAGQNMSSLLLETDRLKDATDCKALFDAGEITLAETDTGDAPAAAAAVTSPTPIENIDFGDDSSNWAKDGECDDPRFTGANMAEELLDEDMLKDATDCQALYEAGEITLVQDAPSESALPATINDIDFGDDSSEWANDMECDDPRFVGIGMAQELSDDNEKADASDCRSAYEDGTIRLQGEADPLGTSTPPRATPSANLEAIASRIDFGDNSGEWANDGECDDPDFFGPGSSNMDGSASRLSDADDCRAAFLAGEVTLKTSNELNVSFDFGDDTSRWANDGECDDPRFTGPNLNKKMLFEDILSDASDCQALLDAGEVSIKPVFTPEYILGAPYDSSGIDFGDDTSNYANDGQCDDPRFEGPGVAGTLLDADTRADATDCQAAFEGGEATLIEGRS